MTGWNYFAALRQSFAEAIKCQYKSEDEIYLIWGNSTIWLQDIVFTKNLVTLMLKYYWIFTPFHTQNSTGSCVKILLRAGRDSPQCFTCALRLREKLASLLPRDDEKQQSVGRIKIPCGLFSHNRLEVETRGALRFMGVLLNLSSLADSKVVLTLLHVDSLMQPLLSSLLSATTIVLFPSVLGLHAWLVIPINRC